MNATSCRLLRSCRLISLKKWKQNAFVHTTRKAVLATTSTAFRNNFGPAISQLQKQRKSQDPAVHQGKAVARNGFGSVPCKVCNATLHNRRDSATDCPATNGAFISCYRKKAEGNSSSPLRLRWLPGPLLLASRNRSGSPRVSLWWTDAPPPTHPRPSPEPRMRIMPGVRPRVSPAWSRAEVGRSSSTFPDPSGALQRLEVPLLALRCNP